MPRILKATASSSATNAPVILDGPAPRPSWVAQHLVHLGLPSTLSILGGRATSGSYLLSMNLLILLGEAAQKSRFLLVTLPTSGPVSWQ